MRQGGYGATRISFVGDSVIWGNGALQDSFLDELADLIYADSEMILPEHVTISGIGGIIKNEKLYKGTAIKIQGIGASLSFTMNSDRLILCDAMDRCNSNACVCELYCNGELLDKFSNFNEKNECGTASVSFVGDGVSRMFSLGRCFTYLHSVSVDDTPAVGGLNTQGYGAAFPAGDDYMVIRKVSDGKVSHFLYFYKAPCEGAVISCSYHYGESRTYTKCSIGEVGQSLESGMESAYGDAAIVFDPSKPSYISSGLDFREVNEDAIRRYRFAEKKSRSFLIKIVAADTRTASKTPAYLFNFATSIDYFYQNAGIGGYTYALANDEENVTTNYRKVLEFQPDLIFSYFGANDDWTCAEYPVYEPVKYTLDEIMNSSYHFYNKKPEASDAGQYDCEYRWCSVKEWGNNHIVMSDACVGYPLPGDILIVNQWTNDERYCQVRLIDRYDAETGKISFLKPLELSQINGNTKVMIKRLSKYIENVNQFITNIQKCAKPVKIVLCAPGVPNGNHRQLLGYREILQKIAADRGTDFIDFFEVTSQFMAHMAEPENHFEKEILSDGSHVYEISNSIDPILRSAKVWVDGMDLMDGYRVKISGGYGYYYDAELNCGYHVQPTRLILQEAVEPGKKIRVEGNTGSYSHDFCHMGRSSGEKLYANAVYGYLENG